MDRIDVNLYPAGVRCSAWLYRPDGMDDNSSAPCVVLGHGFSAVRDQRLDAFAERFAKAGMAALVFDYRHFGDSDGEPRQLLDIGKQLADWRTAIAFVRAQRGIDPDRIVAWGSSFSGGHSISIAAEDHRLAAAVAQGPFADGLANLVAYGPKAVLRLSAHGIADQVSALLGRQPHLIPAVAEPGGLAVITTPDAVSGFASITSPTSSWRNEVAARVALWIAFYRPVARAKHIRCPILFCIASDDVVTPPGAARRAAAAAPLSETKEYPGGHFTVYTGDTFERLVADQLEFLERHIPGII
ncbi:MAG: alpha/beta hydrolase [Sciscionella sp.]